MKKVYVLIGNYGSGKTELALNLAFQAAEQGKRTELLDLDMVNTYFRLAERGRMTRMKEIRLVTPNFACSGIETLSVPAEVASAFAMDWDTVIFDVGGDAVGATAIGRYHQDFMELEPGALDLLVAAAEAHPEFGVLSPMQYQDGYEKLDRQFEKRYARAGGPRYDSGKAKGRVIPSEASGSPVEASGSPVEVSRIMAAHWLVPVQVIERIGPFEETLFPLYGQDDEWCQRLYFFGLKVGVIPSARAVHDRACRPESKEKLAYRNFYTGSLVRLCRYHRPLWVNFLFILPFALVKAFKYRSLLPFKYLVQIFKDLPTVKELRSRIRARA